MTAHEDRLADAVRRFLSEFYDVGDGASTRELEIMVGWEPTRPTYAPFCPHVDAQHTQLPPPMRYGQ
jgi:hypothetical protein